MSKAKYKVEIEEKKFTIDFEDLQIDEANLDELLCTQPEKHSRYARIAGLAKIKAERLEYRLEELENNLDLAIRDAKAKKGKPEDGEMKMTEGRIKSMVITNSSRIALVNELMQAKEQYEVAMAAKEGSAHKKDCLISIGANRRAEYDGSLSIKKK